MANSRYSLKISLFWRECEWDRAQRERERENPQAESPLRVEPDTGLDPRSLSVGVNVEHKISHYTWLAKI